VIVQGTGAGLLAGWLLPQAHVSVSVWYCVLLAIGAAALLRIARFVTADLEASPPLVHGPVAEEQSPSTELLWPLERSLSGAANDRRRYVIGLQPTLYRLARDRLHRSGGPDLDSMLDTTLARHVLGDELWHWLTIKDCDGPAPTPRQLDRLIAAIEQL
jgi:hypothetical protein